MTPFQKNTEFYSKKKKSKLLNMYICLKKKKRYKITFHKNECIQYYWRSWNSPEVTLGKKLEKLFLSYSFTTDHQHFAGHLKQENIFGM